MSPSQTKQNLYSVTMNWSSVDILHISADQAKLNQHTFDIVHIKFLLLNPAKPLLSYLSPVCPSLHPIRQRYNTTELRLPFSNRKDRKGDFDQEMWSTQD